MTKGSKFFAVMLLFISFDVCHAGFSYSVQEIPALSANFEVNPRGLNDKGDVTGWEQAGSNNVPFLFSNGVLTSLVAGSAETSGFGSTVDQRGVVGGNAGSSSKVNPATFSNGKVQMLPTGAQGGYLNGGNAAGQFVGYIFKGSTWDAATWIGGKLQILKGIPGEANLATAINSHAEIVGYYQTGPDQYHAYSWTNGVVGSFNLDSYSMSGVVGLNDNGDVVGTGTDPQGKFSNFAIIADRVVRLSPLAGGEKYGPDAAGGEAINDSDQIVGASQDASGNNRAVLFEDGKTIDLNTEINPKLGYSLGAAFDINNRGQILAQGIAGGRQMGFILTPQAIPLPPSVWMGLTTMPLLGLALWRKRCAV